MAPTIDTARYGLLQSVIDQKSLESGVERFAAAGIVLPTFAQLAEPWTIPASIQEELRAVDPNEAHPLNLFRVHWYNGWGRPDQVAVPEHVVLPSELTGVDAPIVAVFGNRFPMIGAHKVLAAYACLVARVVTGQFDPTRHRAVWPSTGNYARGGVAISRLMQSRGVAVLPENMSRERFDWLDRWIGDPTDIIRTPGSESNVKEIYDACRELDREEGNFILNQFSEFANHIAHYEVTGRALGQVFEHLRSDDPYRRLALFTAASGSAGTLGAGDWLKERYGAQIAAVEALECPTMLYNGFGEHNIQGIGDKHIPLIHNVMNTDFAVAVSDRATDGLNLVFTTEAGTGYLAERAGVDPAIVAQLRHMGFSSICNVLASIKVAKHLGLGPDDVVITVATDGSEMYESEKAGLLAGQYPEGFGAVDAARIFGEHLAGADVAHVEELDAMGRERIFNLGYYTWVEQQGVSIDDFEVRRRAAFWDELHSMAPGWDDMIRGFNALAQGA